MSDLIERVEGALPGAMPERYRRFLSDKEYESLAFLHLKEGFVRGCFATKADDADYLCDLGAIGSDYGIDDIDDIDWSGDFAGYAPFAVLDVVDEEGEVDDEESSELGTFLVIKVDDADCPIYVFEEEGWMLYPLAATLDDFIAGNAWTGKDPAPHDNLGDPYEEFEWVDEVPEDDDE
jgi:hypothetical protein